MPHFLVYVVIRTCMCVIYESFSRACCYKDVYVCDICLKNEQGKGGMLSSRMYVYNMLQAQGTMYMIAVKLVCKQ
jgi:hypothetical protein